jgi:hypothetical protein
MSPDSWPSPDARRGSLPRIEDLPIADHGYDQEATRRAFDDFYRHVAQLDATLKTLEAVEAFQRDAAELRSDLRSLRALGFGSPAAPSWETRSWTEEPERPHVSPAALRVAGEAALLIVVAVLIGIADVRPLAVIGVMAVALGVVWLCEWLAARARTRVPTWINEPYGFGQPLPEVEPVGFEAIEAEPIEELVGGEPAQYVEAAVPDPEVGWSAFESEAVVNEGEPLSIGAESVAVADEADPPPDPEEPEPEDPRGGWLRRRRTKEPLEEPVEQRQEPVGHVRVLAASEVDEEPWERGFDGAEDTGVELDPGDATSAGARD